MLLATYGVNNSRNDGITKRCTGIVHHPQFSNQSRPAQSRDRRRYPDEKYR